MIWIQRKPRASLSKCSFVVILCLNMVQTFDIVQSFSLLIPPTISTQGYRSARVPSCLFATKKKKVKQRKQGQSPTSGFGGAAMEPCPCGSNLGYSKCCGKLHSDASAYSTATAEQVVRARYSAYAKRHVDFIMASTHPLNKDFSTDIKHWKATITKNMYDNFELTKCTIVSETYHNDHSRPESGSNNEKAEAATVQFIAELVQRDSQEMTGFMETSTFERAKTHRGWLYKGGSIESAPAMEIRSEIENNGNNQDGGKDGFEEEA